MPEPATCASTGADAGNRGAWARQCSRLRQAGPLLWLAVAMTGLPSSAQAPASPGTAPDEAILKAAREASFVLLGEATHGTSEFYSERASLTESLLGNPRTGAVVIEADGTEVERVNRYVRGAGQDGTAGEALSAFRRFPRWMWRNREFAAFVEALRAANLRRPEAARVGLYGMDVYDLYGALDQARAYVRRYLPKAIPAADAAARCFAPYRRDTEAYGIASRKPARSCAVPAQALLTAISQANPPAGAGGEQRFAALQAAYAVADAEAYFRAAYAGAYSWNVRERSMAATIRRVAAHATATLGGPARVVVWTHNSHVAHAASTAMADSGETSIADLLREHSPDQVFTTGFLTHSGTFMAAPAWGRPGQIYRLAPASRNSVEGLIRRAGSARSALMLRGAAPAGHAEWRPQRGVGAVFDPGQAEAAYSRVRLATEFDAVIFLDQTSAVTPLP